MLGPTAPKNCWVFTEFPVGFSQNFPFLMLSHDFPLLMQNFPHAHTNKHTTMVPAESVKIYRYSDPKQFPSAKLFFTYSKTSLQEFVYVRLFFTYSEITAQNKNLCM